MGSSDLCTRQKQNRAYAQQARIRLAELWWWEELSVPRCVLTEVGRIQDDALFREAAWWYGFYARGLKAKQAAAKIKEMRLGKTPLAGPATLYIRMMRTVRDFRIAYPDASHWYVEQLVELALRAVRSAQAARKRA